MVRHISFKEIIKDQSLVVALMERGLEVCASECVNTDLSSKQYLFNRISNLHVSTKTCPFQYKCWIYASWQPHSVI